MLLKSTVAAATLALTATIAPPAHAVDVIMCTATSISGTRAYCTFIGPPGYYKVTMSSDGVRYAWAQIDCPNSAPLHAGAWDTEGGYAESMALLAGGQCKLTVAAGTSTGTRPGHATGVAYYTTL